MDVTTALHVQTSLIPMPDPPPPVFSSLLADIGTDW